MWGVNKSISSSAQSTLSFFAAIVLSFFFEDEQTGSSLQMYDIITTYPFILYLLLSFFSLFCITFVSYNRVNCTRLKLSVFALICLSLTACGSWKKGYERISFSQEWDFVLGGGQTDAFISEGDTLCEGMDGYRKQFKLSEKDKGKVICLDFERATLNRKIWL